MASAVMERTSASPSKVMSRGGYVIRWIEKHCVHTKGKWYGKPFRLLPWQKKFIIQLFEIDPDTGRRKIREAYLRVPKKNGKTELIAALDCFFAAADREPAPEVYCAANSDEQANLVFGAAKTMCEKSPTLSRITERFAKEIYFQREDGTVGKIIRLSATVGTNDGLNVSHGTFDELHEFTATKGAAMYDVVTNGTASREEPMIIEISTAGFDEDSLEYRKYEYGKRVNAGEIDDPTFLFVNFEAPAEADYRDLATWAIANPSWGITVHEDYARDQIRKKPEGIIRRYNLNQQTETENPWLPIGAWHACESPLDLDPNLPIVLAWDAARKRDATAVITLQRQAEGIVARARIWERPLNPANGQPDESWVTPTVEVMEHIREQWSAYDVTAVGYDPWGIKESVQTLEGEGIPMVEVPQTNARMIPATEYLYELITNGTFAHDGSPDYARHMRNAVARQVPNGIRIDKMRSRKPQDAAVATVIAAYLLMTDEPEEDTEPSILVLDLSS